MSKGLLTTAALVGAAGAVLAKQLPEIRRYKKISSM